MDLWDGHWFDTSTGDVAVIDQVAAENLGVGLGDTVEIPPGLHGSALAVKIVGIVHKPVFFAQHSATMYLPMETLQHFTGQNNPPLVSSISINLRPNLDPEAFKDRWTAKLAMVDPALRVQLRRENSG